MFGSDNRSNRDNPKPIDVGCLWTVLVSLFSAKLMSLRVVACVALGTLLTNACACVCACLLAHVPHAKYDGYCCDTLKVLCFIKGHIFF